VTGSVIISSYNKARYIGQAIESVLAQTLRDVELIVVDDGSTDETERLVLTRYAGGVTYLRQENLGPAAARNAGFYRTSGEYVLFLDADDFLTPDCLEKKIRVLEEKREVGWVYSDIYLTDETGRVTGLCSQRFRYGRRKLTGWILGELLLGNFIPIHAPLIRRACVDRIGGFDEAFRMFQEDYNMLFRLSSAFPVEYISEPLGYYRQLPGSRARNPLPVLLGTLQFIEAVEREFPSVVRARRGEWAMRKSDVWIQMALKVSGDASWWKRYLWICRAIKIRPFQGAAYRVLLKCLVGRSGERLGR
jgi:glycosyltransferase involved in cell wall biosynthesis